MVVKKLFLLRFDNLLLDISSDNSRLMNANDNFAVAANDNFAAEYAVAA